MLGIHADRPHAVHSFLLISLCLGTSPGALAQEPSPDTRAAETERQMTDDERFSLLISILGNVAGSSIPPDPRVKDLKNPSAGYTPGISRLGIPALQSSEIGRASCRER